MARKIRKGDWVRYVGSDARTASAWGKKVFRVDMRSGNRVVGFFPLIFTDGKIHCCYYSMSTDDLAIVAD